MAKDQATVGPVTSGESPGIQSDPISRKHRKRRHRVAPVPEATARYLPNSQSPPAMPGDSNGASMEAASMERNNSLPAKVYGGSGEESEGTEIQQTELTLRNRISTEERAEIASAGFSQRNSEDSERRDSFISPLLYLKEKDAAMKKKLEEVTARAINMAEAKFSLNMDKGRLKGTALFLTAAFLAVAGAFHVYLLNKALGPPPAFSAARAATNLVPYLLLTALLAMTAVIILYLKITFLWVAFAWHLFLAILLYGTGRIIGDCIYFTFDATFLNIREYSNHYYSSHQQVPPYFNYYEETGDCCGWGDETKMYEAWPEALQQPDLSDSCCLEFAEGCGKGAVQRDFPSGYIMILSEAEYQELKAANASLLDDQLLKDNSTEMGQILQAYPPTADLPDVILRWLDEIKDAPSFYYLGMGLTSSNSASAAYVYRSYGLVEKGRLGERIKIKTCDADILFTDAKTHTWWILIYGSLQVPLAIIMYMIFWYYYVDLQANYLAKQREPSIFKILRMERICIDDGIDKLIQKKHKFRQAALMEIEKLKQKRAAREEAIKKKKYLDEAKKNEKILPENVSKKD